MVRDRSKPCLHTSSFQINHPGSANWREKRHQQPAQHILPLHEKQLPPLEAAMVLPTTSLTCKPIKQVPVCCLHSLGPQHPFYSLPSLGSYAEHPLLCPNFSAFLPWLDDEKELLSAPALPPVHSTACAQLQWQPAALQEKEIPAPSCQWPYVAPACCGHTAVAGEGRAANAGSCALSHAVLEMASPSVKAGFGGDISGFCQRTKG